MPIDRAVPAMIFSAASRSFALRSASLLSAISRTCERLIDATLLVCGSPEPFSTPAAFRISRAAGGVLVMNEKLRSSYTVISTGTTLPRCDSVAALYCLQNSMMLTPCWPSAGPTGGAGVAAPAWIWSLMRPVTFFFLGGISRVLTWCGFSTRSDDDVGVGGGCRGSDLRDLAERQL